jgi:hypothetical protein
VGAYDHVWIAKQSELTYGKAECTHAVVFHRFRIVIDTTEP